jgi:UDP-N-acetylmuramoyl-tripeptide--D-alanyl-D-alanine ligase
MIFDAYNASMSGTMATLDSFARELAGRRIAVLGSMAELGGDAAAMHARVGAAAAQSGVDVLLVGGEFASELAGGARTQGFAADRIVAFQRNAEAVAWLRDNLHAGDLVLLKASRKYKLEEIVEGLRAALA